MDTNVCPHNMKSIWYTEDKVRRCQRKTVGGLTSYRAPGIGKLSWSFSVSLHVGFYTYQ